MSEHIGPHLDMTADIWGEHQDLILDTLSEAGLRIMGSEPRPHDVTRLLLSGWASRPIEMVFTMREGVTTARVVDAHDGLPVKA